MHKQPAQMLVEFALITPILLALALGILGFGRAFYAHIDLTNTARLGARYAISQPKTWCDQPELVAFMTPYATQSGISLAAADPVKLDCAGGRRTVSITGFPFETYFPGLGVIDLSASVTLPVVNV